MPITGNQNQGAVWRQHKAAPQSSLFPEEDGLVDFLMSAAIQHLEA